MINKRFIAVLIILALLITGFMRENFFESINQILSLHSDYGNATDFNGYWSFLAEMSPKSLQFLKWVASFLFVIVFWLLTLFLARTIYQTNQFSLPISLIFIGVLVVAGISIAIGQLFSSSYSSFYYFARWLIGSAQSPLLPAIVCIAIYYFNTRAGEEKK